MCVDYVRVLFFYEKDKYQHILNHTLDRDFLFFKETLDREFNLPFATIAL